MRVLVSQANMHGDLSALSRELVTGIEADIKMDTTDQHGNRFGFDVNWDRMHYDYDFVVGMDEDAFLVRPDSLLKIIRYMNDNNIGFAGMPEKGVSKHRDFSSKYMNPFFVIFNIGIIKNVPMDESVLRTYDGDASKRESSWGIFGYLKDKKVSFLDFQGHDHADGITTILKDLEGKDFLYHTWYAREWDSEPHRSRIINIYNEVLKIRDLEKGEP
ncbi:MAG TPA: hypothetical protein VJ000_01220 [Thermodesulfovibrionia bacterium]|nr:hypothetical protein [Thermodesulfovibrionia bacterium]